MSNFLLFKIGKIAIYIGPYKLAFNECEAAFIDESEVSNDVSC